ncbi:helix-turn-helix transcriptional regulator [Streptomyces sp. S3(2020)]|uniref:AraC family transcriptional regulator n=1 Tax=Streptomyces sp. S3(2020) TaxID=2732044 RepID=UPI001489D519|nr:AraC family transcriptional regulator [Streptomyces sp. S3(2020)]NNN30610.1 helix-turn-helix transcriptional regulator [Streptomyces sp. S3(2020)]
MEQPPVARARGLFFLTHGAQAYAGPYLHEGDFALHTHSYVEVVVVIEGEGVHLSPAGRRTLQVGDVLVLRPGLWHGYEGCRQLTVYNCCFSADLLLRELAWMREDPLLGHLLWRGPRAVDRKGLLSFRLGAPALQECLPHLDALNALRHAPVRLRRGDLVGRLTLLLSALARVAVVTLPNGAQESARTHPAVAQAMRLLESRPAQPWTVSELAADLHVSAGYLARRFKSVTGLPPMAYLSQHRAAMASDLLLHTDLSVSHVGREVGWPDANLFARRFRAHTGMSPSDYRRRFMDAS